MTRNTKTNKARENQQVLEWLVNAQSTIGQGRGTADTKADTERAFRQINSDVRYRARLYI